MFSVPPLLLLLALVPIAIGMAMLAPLHWLILLDLLLYPLFIEVWSSPASIGGIRLDPTDLLYGILVLGALARGGGQLRLRGLPLLGWWLLLGALLSYSYLSVPVNQEFIRSWTQIPYLLVRYVWLPILPFPLAVWFLSEERRARSVFPVLIAVGLLFCYSALEQVLAGELARGPFTNKNGLGAVLVAPVLLSIVLLFGRRGGRRWWLTLVVFVVLTRVFMFTTSKGAFAGIASGAALIVVATCLRSEGRKRLPRVAAVGLLIGMLAVMYKPNVLERPNVRRFTQLSEPLAVDTMQWRMQQRWPHFWQMAVDNPWKGTGIIVDETLGKAANTPHNSYLGLAVKYGFPAAAVFVLFGLFGLWHGLRLFFESETWERAILGLGVAAAIVGLLVHAFADNTLTAIVLVPRTMFLLSGLAVGLRRYAPAAEVAEEVERPMLPRPAAA